MGELVLFPIRTEEDRVRALKIIDDLLMEDPAEGSEREALLEAFITLVEKYESKSWEALPRDPVRTVRFVMEQNGLSQKDLAPYFGSAPRVSEFLSGKIPLTLKTIRNLHHSFNIPLEMLMLDDGEIEPQVSHG